jgi:SAM-dependent methyltransferase
MPVATGDTFVDPESHEPLERDGDELVAPGGARFPIRDGIPRFTEDPAYAASFGEQWNRWRAVQLDSQASRPHSRERFYAGTGWTPEELAEQRVLEAGCGAGRFTSVLLSAGAHVFAVDATSAVDACRRSNPDADRLVLAQADILGLPFAPGGFDRVFCYGVLQHTPDPRTAFLRLADQLRPGGEIAADVYRKQPYVDRWSAKRLWRPLTTRLPTRVLRRIVEWYVPRWLPVDTRLARVPRLGRFLVAIVPCWNYTGLLELSPDELVAWAVLDTFDALAPRYDKPQTVESVASWCTEAGLVDVDVRSGGNGVLVNARRP